MTISQEFANRMADLIKGDDKESVIIRDLIRNRGTDAAGWTLKDVREHTCKSDVLLAVWRNEDECRREVLTSCMRASALLTVVYHLRPEDAEQWDDCLDTIHTYICYFPEHYNLTDDFPPSPEEACGA